MHNANRCHIIFFVVELEKIGDVSRSSKRIVDACVTNKTANRPQQQCSWARSRRGDGREYWRRIESVSRKPVRLRKPQKKLELSDRCVDPEGLLRYPSIVAALFYTAVS